jgi:UDP-GlcNAc:undecaprenyl-phosphate GlcNAc-1-phosphate transferase
VTLASGLGALLLHRLNAFGACVVMAQTTCLLGLIAILEFSGSGSERADVQAGREAINSEAVAVETGRAVGHETDAGRLVS